MLDAVARRLNPAHGQMFSCLPSSYYWSAFQTGWATDTAFRSSSALAEIYPQLVRGAIATLQSRDVLRFLGNRPDRRYQGEVISDYKDRPEGVRVKHRAYDRYAKALASLDTSTPVGQLAAKVSYRLRTLRAHGLIRKSPKRRRYHLTTKGRQIITALLQAQHATLQ